VQALAAVSLGDSTIVGRQGQHMLGQLPGSGSDSFLHDVDSSQRNKLKFYITRCFEQACKAQIIDFAPLLLELQCAGSTHGVDGK